MKQTPQNTLPIHDVLTTLSAAIKRHDSAVVIAPPGAGKTTIVPLSLLEQLKPKGKILVLEPRRMAARAVACRMAELIDEPIGQTVGYRIRGESNCQPSSKIEVITGGVLLRMVQEDPSLEQVSLIIFDEFHERNLDSDLALALLLHARTLFRDESNPLKLVVMSATLNGEKISEYLNQAPIIESQGKMFPVESIYCGELSSKDIATKICDTIVLAHQKHAGNLLVFLPGQKEIRQAAETLRSQLPTTTLILPLYGALPLKQQLLAIAPTATGHRKIVLATDIAETSLTIEGITVVVDSCFHRAPVFDKKSGLTRLITQRISRASVKQRAGRAGRLSPGTSYQFISPSTSLTPHASPEIEQADLSSIALQLLHYGVNSTTELQWLTPPPPSAYQNAIQLLQELGAIKQTKTIFSLTEHGKEIVKFGVHPRLAHMILKGQQFGLARESCLLASALAEPSRPSELSADIALWLPWLKQNTHHHWSKRVVKQARQFEKQLATYHQSTARINIIGPEALLISLAYPDRIAQQRPQQPEYFLLSNGRAARLSLQSLQSPWLAVAETTGHQGQSEDRITCAAALSEVDILTHLSSLVQTKQIVEWSETQQRLLAEERKQLGAITLSCIPIQKIDNAIKKTVLKNHLQKTKLADLNWTNEATQLCDRVNTARTLKVSNSGVYQGNSDSASTEVHNYPNCTTEGLTESIDEWLTPYLTDVTTQKDLKKLDLLTHISNYIGWQNIQALNTLVPQKLTVPSGFSVAIDYSSAQPTVKVKLQEMFGCSETPTIANGQVPVTLHLLSPAKRPLQITQDIAGFWRNSYKEVQKEMKGRYPKHPWPDNPLEAQASRFTKKKNNNK